jgi:hypothetical protein
VGPTDRFGNSSAMQHQNCTGLCTAGRFSSPGAVVCTGTCAAGSFSEEGSGSCSACPAGFSCPLGSIIPLLCPAGRYAPLGSSQCRNCDLGYACSPGATSSNPPGDVCSPGKFSNVSGAVSCKNCSAGFACPLPEGTVAGAQLCQAGQFSVGGQAVCTPCWPGFYGITTGAVNGTCSGLCTAGSFCTGGEEAPIGCTLRFSVFKSYTYS